MKLRSKIKVQGHSEFSPQRHIDRRFAAEDCRVVFVASLAGKTEKLALLAKWVYNNPTSGCFI